jgi:hypothetical protein
MRAWLSNKLTFYLAARKTGTESIIIYVPKLCNGKCNNRSNNMQYTAQKNYVRNFKIYFTKLLRPVEKKHMERRISKSVLVSQWNLVCTPFVVLHITWRCSVTFQTPLSNSQ